MPARLQSAHGPQVIGGLIITGGTLALRGSPRTRMDLALARSNGRLIVHQVGNLSGLQATDTIDASGLYILNANAYTDSDAVRVGAPAMFTIRTGPSLGSAALWIVSGLDWRRVAPSENMPATPRPAVVGCYDLQVGAWGGTRRVQPNRRISASVLPLPNGVRLHWQYLLHIGREDLLVATDLHGAVPLPYRIPMWQPAAGDSIKIVFSNGFQGYEFHVGRQGSYYVGTVTMTSDAKGLEPEPGTSVRMQHIACPEL